MSGDLSPETIDSINEALFAGDLIRAVKVYRAATDASLREANTFVAALQARLRAEMPERFPVRARKGAKLGWSGIVLILAMLALKLLVSNLLKR